MNARTAVRRVPRLAAAFYVVAVTLSGVSVGGCGNQDVVTGTDSPPEVTRIPDMAEETSRTRAYLYDPDNPFTVATVERLLGRRDVDAMVASFEARGMELVPDDCLVMEGVDHEGETLVTFIGLAPRGPDRSEIGVVACFERDGRIAVAPGVFTSRAARADGHFLKLADDLWMNTGPLPDIGPSSDDTARWTPNQWNQFWECVLIYAPGPVSACFVGCFFAGPGYLQCAVACVSTQSLSVVVRCATRVLMDGRAGDNDRTVE